MSEKIIIIIVMIINMTLIIMILFMIIIMMKIGMMSMKLIMKIKKDIQFLIIIKKQLFCNLFFKKVRKKLYIFKT